jgi:uncharacterized Zn finger protein
MPNSEHLVVAVIPAACPSCRSTERESIRIVIEREAAGTMPSGQPRTHIVWRRVRCKNCGQYYIEQEHRNRVAEKTIGNPDSFTPKNVDAPPPDA